MSLPWFKFYATDFLTDPKILFLSPTDKYLFVVLLCLASTADKGGFIPNLTEDALLKIAYVQKDQTFPDVLTVFQNYGLVTKSDKGVTVSHFEERQSRSLTPAERSQIYRDKQKKHKELDTNIINRHEKVTGASRAVTDRHLLDETRVDKIRKEKNIKKEILKNSTDKRTPLSAIHLWKIAGEKNVRLQDLIEIQKNILDDINGENKYKIKSINLALHKWLKIQLAKGYIYQMNELERLEWEASNPDVVANDRKNTQFLVGKGIL